MSQANTRAPAHRAKAIVFPPAPQNKSRTTNSVELFYRD